MCSYKREQLDWLSCTIRTAVALISCTSHFPLPAAAATPHPSAALTTPFLLHLDPPRRTPPLPPPRSYCCNVHTLEVSDEQWYCFSKLGMCYGLIAREGCVEGAWVREEENCEEVEEYFVVT